jgi:hypothetical protein
LVKAGSIRGPSEIARGFAPLTRKYSILLFDRMIHTL